MIIKICGLKETENIVSVDDLSPELTGYIFYEKSPRYIVTNSLPMTKSKRVGVFVNEKIEKMLEIALQFDLKVIQLHGQEPAATAAILKEKGYLVMKAFNIGEVIDQRQMAPYVPHADYFLFDTKGQQAGGNGVKFDWRLLETYDLPIPFLLSGGIGPGDIANIQAIRHPALAGVDLNSGFEDRPGLKNISLLKTFIDAIRN